MTFKKSRSFLKSETFINVSNAFAGECQARMRYDYFTKVADKEGYKFIEDIFRETAMNEKAHSKVYYNFLVNNAGKEHIKLTGEFPIFFSNTKDNLLYSTEAENEEWKTIYPYGAKVAEEEGFLVIADGFRKIAEVEEEHAKRFFKLYEMIKEGTLYKDTKIVKWKCRNCGYIHEGFEAPDPCPNCRHEIGFFERYMNYFENIQ